MILTAEDYNNGEYWTRLTDFTYSEGNMDVISTAKRILTHEAESIRQLAETLDDRFLQATKRLLDCEGSVIVCGIGKAGLIGQKITATLASTGTAAHFLHPAEAIHGDLGRISDKDVVLMLSQSGETEEIRRILPSIRKRSVPIIAITSSVNSTLGQNADLVLPIGTLVEADPLRLAPSTSTAVMLALGDALALVVSQLRGFCAEDFAQFHPGGALGRKLSLVDDYLRPITHCRTAPETETVRDVFVRHAMPGRRSGAILLLDIQGKLTGIFTDSDLAKLFEKRSEDQLDKPIRLVMTANPICVPVGSKMLEAVSMMGSRRISELPVVDAECFPVGLIDVTDIVAVFPEYTAWNHDALPRKVA